MTSLARLRDQLTTLGWFCRQGCDQVMPGFFFVCLFFSSDDMYLAVCLIVRF